MPTLPTKVRFAYAQKTTPATLYYECTRCGRKRKTYRKIKKPLRSCGK
jgi:ribosomal protein S14